MTVMDVNGWPQKNTFFRDMTPQEEQQYMSENPMLQQAMQIQLTERIKNQSKLDQIELENTGRLVRDIVKEVLKELGVQQRTQDQADMAKGRVLAQDMMGQVMQEGIGRATGMQPGSVSGPIEGQPGAISFAGGTGGSRKPNRQGG